MADARRYPPFFQLPFPAPAPLWPDLSLSARTPWYSWAYATKLGFLDLKYQLRTPEEAYTFARTMYAGETLGLDELITPPPPPSLFPVPVAQRILSATIDDSISFRPILSPDTDLPVQVWATAPAVTKQAILVQQNSWITTFVIPAGQPIGRSMNDVGAAYAAKVTSLAGSVGQFIMFWWFTSQGGQLKYAGSVVQKVTTLSIAGFGFQWPLEEFSGLRNSLGQARPLIPNGVVGQTAAGGQMAALFTLAAPGFLEDLNTELPWNPTVGWTILGSVQLTSFATDMWLFGFEDNTSPNGMGLAVGYVFAANLLFVNIWDGVALTAIQLGVLGGPAPATPFRFGVSIDIASGNGFKADSNDPVLGVGFVQPTFPQVGKWRIGNGVGGGLQTDGAIWNVTLMERAMTSNEVGTWIAATKPQAQYPFPT
jgi:hypothetical protein